MTATQAFDAQVRRFDLFKLLVASVMVAVLGLLTIPGASHGPKAQASENTNTVGTAPVALAPTVPPVAAPSVAPTPEAPPAVAVKPECKVQGAQPMVLSFATDSASLSSADLAALQQWSACHPGQRLQVTGHADARGSDEYNQNLSANRAKAVAAQLEQAGIAPDLLVVEAVGEAQPLDPANTAAAWAKNRRVEVKLL
jgi:outer membrane protein OmpA-like peptidoglycan-associated protein